MKKPVILVILSLIAFGLASYISWSTFTEKQLAGCGEEGSGCNEVIKTKWGSWMGIPVSYAGVAIYGALLIVSILSLKKSTSTTWMALVFFTVLAATSGLWFMSLQLFVIRDICYFCTAIHTCGIIMAILVLRTIPISDGRNKKELKTREDWVRKSNWVRTIFIAMIGTGILIAGQFVRSENRMASPVQTQQTPTEAPQQTTPPPAPVPVPPAPSEGRKISLLNGSVQLNLGEYPVIGSPEAKQIYAVFLDYTCPACRQLHPFLSDFIKKNPDKVAVIVLPLPLDADCNPKIPQTAYQHKGACNFWRLALSVWNVSPEAFQQWDEYMFQFEFPPTPQEARSQADQLVGSNTMDAALSDSRVPDLLRRGIQLFESPAIARKSLPTLITDKEAFTGVGPSQSYLLSLP